MSSRAFALIGLALGSASSLVAQGPLAPPGAPAPAMKTLDQIASTGIAVNATNTPGDADNVFVINQPGNYFLIGNVSVPAGKTGVFISGSGVTLDLNGFQISGPGSGTISTGVLALGANTCAIKNGFITNFSSANSAGISCHANGAIITNIGVSNCFGGIELFGPGDGAIVSFCTATNCSFAGLLISGSGAVVTNCTATHGTGSSGISVASTSTLTNCAVYANTSSRSTSAGISAGANCTLIGCTASTNTNSTLSNNAGVGIVVGNDSTLKDCTVQGNSGDGIQAGSHCTVNGATANGNGTGTIGSGINAGDDSNVGGCNAQGNKNTGILLGQRTLARSCAAHGNNNGITALDGASILDCAADANQQNGIVIHLGGTVARCTTRGNLADGVQAYTSCRVVENQCDANANGIHTINGAQACRVENNHVTSSTGKGVWIQGSRNFIVGNTVAFCAPNYSIDTDNRYGQIIDLSAVGSPGVSGNSAASQINATLAANYSQ